jgi:glycosyltransferase involved in cell wall biosynthesis
MAASGANIVVAHSCHLAGILAKVKAKEWKWLLNPLHYLLLAREAACFGFRRFQYMIAISEAESALYQKLYRVPREQITVIPNGVDRLRFTPQPIAARISLRQEFGIPEDAPLILFVANEFERKGLGVAIEALPRILEYQPEARLLVVGNYPFNSYRNKAEKLGCEAACIYAGPRQDLATLMSSANVGLMLSSYEPFGLVGIETLACGTPLVSTRVGGMKEYVLNGVNGLFCERTPVDLSDKIRACLALFPKTREREEAIRATTENYAWSNCAERYENLLSRCRAEQMRGIGKI